MKNLENKNFLRTFVDFLDKKIPEVIEDFKRVILHLKDGILDC